jgi:hypothetical protein
MDDELHKITDRECLGGLMTAVIALAEKLTGERLTVYMETEAGVVPFCGDRVRWSRVSRPAGDQGGRHDVMPAEAAIIWAQLPRYQSGEPLMR